MQSYRQLVRYAARQRGFFALIFVATLVASALTALQPWPWKLLADNVLDNKGAPRAIYILFRFVPDGHRRWDCAVDGWSFVPGRQTVASGGQAKARNRNPYFSARATDADGHSRGASLRARGARAGTVSRLRRCSHPSAAAEYAH